MFKQINNAPPNVLAFEAEGKISHDDYHNVLAPAINAAVSDNTPVKILLHFGPRFNGYTARAMADDAALGIKQWSHFGRLAIVTDVPWITNALEVLAPLFPGEVKTLSNDALTDGLEWAAA